jgi:23S rRNA (uridine2552-2'-O)-methyltransferase
MDPLPDVEFLQGDFLDEQVMFALLQKLGDTRVDWVLSDMAPNMSGVDAVDQPRSMYLAELALDFAKQVLKPDGAFLVKVFQGTDSEIFIKNVRACFNQVQIRKPKASRSRSREIYLVAKGFKS